MDLNPVEWTQAQDLLRKLVQTLAPLTNGFAARRPGPPNTASMIGVGLDLIPFNKRLFTPSFGQSLPSFPYPVRLLTVLRSTQQQMEELIEKLPMAEENSFSEKISAKPSEKNEKPVLAKLVEKEGLAVPKKEGGGEHSSVSVSGQAQKIIDQVRDAIGTLSNSANLVDPKAAPLREALKRLKPLVDALIHEVGRGDMPSSDDEAPPTFRFAVPKSPREHLFKKEIPLPQGQDPSLRKAARSTHSWEVPAKSGPHPKDDVFSGSGPHPRDDASSGTPAHAGSHAGSGSNLREPFQQYPTMGMPPVRPQEEPEIKPAEQTSLPGAPYPSSSFQMQKKEKKKRKGLWSSEKEDDQKNS